MFGNKFSNFQILKNKLIDKSIFPALLCGHQPIFYNFFGTKIPQYKSLQLKNQNWNLQDFAIPNKNLKIVFLLDQDKTYENAFQKLKESKEDDIKQNLIDGI